jgi:hypothetical protein
VKPFALDENYRINHDWRLSFTLERRRVNKGVPSDRWDNEGYYSEIAHACRAWAKKVVLESNESLPDALRAVMAQLEVAMASLPTFSLPVGQTVKPVRTR